MAAAKTMNGTSILINVGNVGETTFTHPCLINAARGIQFTSTSNDTLVPDCADPELPAWIGRAKDGLSATVTGAGVLDTDSLADFWDWFLNENDRLCKIKLNIPLADGGGTWNARLHLSEFNVTGDRGGLAEFTCTMISNGMVDWVDAAA